MAERCIESGKLHGIEIEKFFAITPANEPTKIMKTLGLSTKRFMNERFSRSDRCISCFLSHYHLWKKSLDLNDQLLILEHDTIITSKMPEININGACNLGKPSYGKFKIPKNGLGPLTSKQYFPGAHCYLINPIGARHLIEAAKKQAGPTDIFLNNQNFHWLQEYYPWIGEVKDTFTTIQKERGCKAKHGYTKDYAII